MEALETNCSMQKNSFPNMSIIKNHLYMLHHLKIKVNYASGLCQILNYKSGATAKRFQGRNNATSVLKTKNVPGRLS